MPYPFVNQQSSLPTSDDTPIWKSRKLLGAGILGAVFLLWPLIPDGDPILHLSANDRSLSADPFSAERQTHCEAALPYYKPGDRLMQIIFADQAELVNTSEIENRALFNPCTDLEQQTGIIGQEQGTSLIRALEKISILVQSDRQRHPERAVVVTLTLHQAEVVAEQPLMDEAGFAHLTDLMTNIIGNNQGAIAIIGPGGTLQTDLQQQFQSLPNVNICPFPATATCMEDTFALVGR